MKRIFIAGMFFLVVGCTSASTKFNSDPQKLSFYSYDFNSELADRIKICPDSMLNSLMQFDRKTNYFNYTLSPEEKQTVTDYIELLPELYKKILKEKLIGIYFVENFTGNGLTNNIYNDKGEQFYYIVFNKTTVGTNLSQLLTEKENTCFMDIDGKNRIEIDCGTAYSGFLYILFHEVSHIADFEKHFTPGLPEDESYKPVSNETEFTKGVWKGYTVFKIIYNHAYRSKISFYGMNNGPFIHLYEAEELYKIQKNSPFTSLYSNFNWAEDFADFASFYHITQKLKQPYVISVIKDSKTIFKYEPMKCENVLPRFNAVEKIYNEESVK
ncbi:MAG: hypothetical protein JW982_08235 [Spirochaetes bacterium]|nr:hypothetical protein [Spirochaetota bacterium]